MNQRASKWNLKVIVKLRLLNYVSSCCMCTREVYWVTYCHRG